MNKKYASTLMMFSPCVLFLFNDEVLSYLALSIMGVMCIVGLLIARARL